MDLIDTKFIGLISTRLSKFKRVKPNLYNFRCPICGDSKKNKNKSRAYIYAMKNNANFKCHNCGSSLSFNNFLKDQDPQLHKQYTLEKFKSGFTGKNFPTNEPEFVFEKPTFTQKIILPLCDQVESVQHIYATLDSIPKTFIMRKTLVNLCDRSKVWITKTYVKSLESSFHFITKKISSDSKDEL